MTTVDQEDRPVLDFWRCAMLPLRDPGRSTGHADDLSELGSSAAGPAQPSWRLDRFRELVPGRALRGDDGRPSMAGGRCGPGVERAELARLTVNLAIVHHDAQAAGGRRLVYGGHTIGMALAQVCRAVPNIVTVLSWERCDHSEPVHEGDMLSSEVEVTGREPLPGGGGVVHLSPPAQLPGEHRLGKTPCRYAMPR